MLHSASKSSRSSGQLLGLLVAAFYGLFTLLPDSSSVVLSYPWVTIWQIGLLCPVLWLLGMVWQQGLKPLGNGLDWVVGLAIATLVISTLLADFPNQARWYSWAAICLFAALYALNQWLQSSQQRDKLLTWQGYLTIAFIGVSLVLWLTQTLLPELSRLRELRQYGIELPFDFSVLELRNWAPIGHQNYVAGYLVLGLPLLVGLGILQTGKWRTFWFVAVALGLVDLYTTSSRGGLLGLVVLVGIAFALLLWYSAIPRLWLGGMAIGTVVALGVLVLANNRLRTLLTAVFSGQAGGELGYRFITTTAGWQMGIQHPIAGTGLGSVPLVYQAYRPTWAGREAEQVFQLHNTPIQIWAELGLLGVVTLVSAIVLLTYLSIRWLRRPITHADATGSARPPSKVARRVLDRDRLVFWSLASGLLAYTITSLTDYQLDIISISGTIVIYLAVLASLFQSSATSAPTSLSSPTSLSPSPSLPPSLLPLAGLGILLAVTLWLVPIHRAWMLSSQSFLALNQLPNTPDPQRRQELLQTFEQSLSQAHRLAPWEPYYPYQLGWNLGNLSLQTSDPKQQQTLLNNGIQWLRKATVVEGGLPQEFSHTNLGWLLLNRDPRVATQELMQTAQLIPAKRGVLYGVGLSLLAQGKTDLAVTAIVLEILRDPLLLTSPIWRSAELQPIYNSVLQGLEAKYTALLEQNATPGILNTYLHQCRGGLRWWVGNWSAAHADLDQYGVPLSQQVLQLAEGKPVSISPPPQNASAGTLALAAWQNPTNRSEWLQRAWIQATRTAPPENFSQQLLTSMNGSTTLDQWLKQNAPSRSYRRDRLGFGVLSRHIDGTVPADFLVVTDNIPMTMFFNELLLSQNYFQELDRALQPLYNSLFNQLSERNK